MVPGYPEDIATNTVKLQCWWETLMCRTERMEEAWNERNPLPANFKQGCRDSGYLIQIEELKKQLDASESESRWYQRNWNATVQENDRLISDNHALKKQLENERKKNMWSIPVNLHTGKVCDNQAKIKKLESELETKRQKIERQRAELQKLNEHFAIKCGKIAAMADFIKARDAKIEELEKMQQWFEKRTASIEKKNDELRGDIVEAEERVRILSGQLAEEKGLNKAAHEYAALKQKELDLLEKMGLVDRIE
jgi:chromosome segregation ATPase